MGWTVEIRGADTVPTAVCAVCAKPITDARNASYWWSHRNTALALDGEPKAEPKAETKSMQGTRWPVDFVHNGPCCQRLDVGLTREGQALMTCNLAALPGQLLLGWRLSAPETLGQAALMAGLSPLDGRELRKVLKQLGIPRGQPVAHQQEQVAANGEPGEPYLFADGSHATWEGAGESPQRVFIHNRTVIRTRSGELVAAYEVEDRRGTRWIVGNGELSREE